MDSSNKTTLNSTFFIKLMNAFYSTLTSLKSAITVSFTNTYFQNTIDCLSIKKVVAKALFKEKMNYGKLNYL